MMPVAQAGVAIARGCDCLVAPLAIYCLVVALISCMARGLSFVVEMESSECESAEDTEAEQLATVNCTAGRVRVLTRAKVDHLAVDHGSYYC